MNCPHHIKIYRVASRTATATCRCGWRSSAPSIAGSKSGELGGMTRVRGFTQDDAHLFCTEEQVPRKCSAAWSW